MTHPTTTEGREVIILDYRGDHCALVFFLDHSTTGLVSLADLVVA